MNEKEWIEVEFTYSVGSANFDTSFEVARDTWESWDHDKRMTELQEAAVEDIQDNLGIENYNVEATGDEWVNE